MLSFGTGNYNESDIEQGCDVMHFGRQVLVHR